MKLNATTEMAPLTWPEFATLHPFAPPAQAQGYYQLFERLQKWLCEITGYDAISLQPNSGAQGEYAGLLAIRTYHASRGGAHRKVCLIPSSAHGTNPASATMASTGRSRHLREEWRCRCQRSPRKSRKASSKDLAAVMITYPSTHGVFEKHIREICDIVHSRGQVYLDGANLNAQVGLCRPGDYGANVSHPNLHKTFCIPHGGGGPHGSHRREGAPCPVSARASASVRMPALVGPVSAAPYGSASILTIACALHAADGWRRPDCSNQARDPQCQLYRPPTGYLLSGCLRGRKVASPTNASLTRGRSRPGAASRSTILPNG